jgi:hypothetical protein
VSGFLNPDFAVPSETPGVAQGWTIESSAALERVAIFGGRAREMFDWTEHLDALVPAATVRAFFDGNVVRVERFAPGWLNVSLLRSLPDTCIAASFDGEPVEDFEEQWSNDLFLWDFVDGDLLAALFAGADADSFDSGWTTGFVWEWEDLAVSPVPLGPAAEGFVGWPLMETL